MQPTLFFQFCSDGFICLDDSLRCVERDYVCDRYSDCDDGSDEDKQKCADKDTSKTRSSLCVTW